MVGSAQNVRSAYDCYCWLNAHEDAEAVGPFLDSLRSAARTSEEGLLCRVLQAAQLRRKGEVGKAYAAIDSIADAVNRAPGIVRYAHASELALIFKALSVFDKAEPHALQAFHYAQAYGLGPHQVDALSLVAEIHRHRGVYDLAMQRLIEADRLAQTNGFADQRCGVINNKGGLAHSRGLAVEALHHFKEAYECAVAQGLAPLAMRSMSNIGATWYGMDSLGRALESYRAALANADTTVDARFVAQIKGNIGLLLVEMGKYGAAEQNLLAALAGRIAVRDSAGIMDMHMYLSELYHASDRVGIALVHATAARDLAARAGALQRLQQAEYKLFELKEGLGDCEGAVVHLAAQQAVQQRLDSLAFGETTLRLEVAYETEKKDQALALSEEQRRAERTRRNWLIAVSLLLLGIVALLIWNNSVQRRLRVQEHVLHSREVSDLLKQQEINSLEAMMKGQERERERVGRDLHDRIGSMLSSVKLQFSALEGRLTKLEDTQRSQYDKLTGLLDETVAEVRRISHDMVRGTLADFGLLRALQDLGEALDAPGSLKVEMSAFGMEDRLPPPFEIGVYRMVQECVSNVLRHAKASELTIQVTRSGSALNVLVEDNGRGFDAAGQDGGLGLRNIKERATALGGVVAVDSVIGRGTTVSIDLPLS
ncbi:MAG: sensor histidine kinase [Flavobacteriales bacterium]|nr:MAG: sensor histidine kinase [Flavobacteriales bacterium]